MKKLIKLSTDHYIMVDDSKIKEGDWHLKNDKLITRSHIIDETCKKITHSTQPIERMNHGNYSSNVYLDIEKLSLQEVKELIGEVDVEKKAEKFIGCEYEDIEDNIDQIGYDSFIRGYNQALEDNKDKKYTEEDMREALSQAFMASQEGYQITSDEIIQSLQPKTEWEVEIVDGKLKLV